MQEQQVQVEIFKEHSRLNEKQKQIENSSELELQKYKSNILCIQCGKESSKIKCDNCNREDIGKRIKYSLFTGGWLTSSVLLSFLTGPGFIISGGLCCGVLISEAYCMIRFYNK
jgi:hypothetical protein